MKQNTPHTSEAELGAAVRDALEMRGIRYARVCTSKRDSLGGRFGLRLPAAARSTSGGPDLLVMPHGCPVVVVHSVRELQAALARFADWDCLGVELKTKTQLSEAQERWRAFMEPREGEHAK